MAPEPHHTHPALDTTSAASQAARRGPAVVSVDGWQRGDVAVRAAGDMVQVHTRFHDKWWSEGGRTASDAEVGGWVATGEAVVVRVDSSSGTVTPVVIEHAMHAPDLDCCLHKSAEAIRWHCPGCDWTASEAFTSPARRVEMFTDRHGYPPPTDTQANDDPVRRALAHLVRLKDGPRDDVYRAEKEGAWQAARDALTHTGRSA